MNIKKGRKILMEMQVCFVDAGLPVFGEKEITSEGSESDMMLFMSWYKNDSNLAQIKACFFPENDTAELSMIYYPNLDQSMMQNLHEFLNNINMHQIAGHWIVCSGPNRIEYRSAMIVTEDMLDKEQFEVFLKQFLTKGQRYYPQIEGELNIE